MLLLSLAAACGSGSSNDDAAEQELAVASEPADGAESPASDEHNDSDDHDTTEEHATEEHATEEDVTGDGTEDTPATGDGPQLPVTVVDHLGTEVTIESVDRIIPLDGTVAEVVFALGLGDRVVATDLSATYPAEADALPEIGYQRSLTAESIATFAPTVLLATEIAGPPETIEDLRRLGFPLVIVPNESSADGPSGKIRAVAEALGVPERGEVLAQALESTIEAHRGAPGDDAPVVAALYIRGASTQLVLGEDAATHWLIEAAGGVNIATLMELESATPISAESLLVQAPDILLVPAAGLESVGGIEGLLEVGGLGATPAGQNRAVLSYDDQLLLGNGPRTGDLLADLAAAFDELGQP
ncbi:MAG: ABC transporter substrate-binding protein [Actinomycetota bacterium]